MKTLLCAVGILLLALRSAAVSISPLSVVETNPAPDTNFFNLMWTNAAGVSNTGFVAIFGTSSNSLTNAQLLGSGTNGTLLTTNMDTVYVAIFCYDGSGNVSQRSDLLLLTPATPVLGPVTNIVLTSDVNVVNQATVQQSPDLVSWSDVAPFFGVIETIPPPPSPMAYRLHFPNGDGLPANLSIAVER